MRGPFCASSPEAAALSDGEFWARVYPQPEEPEPWTYEDPPEIVIGHCLRCGSIMGVEDYEEAMDLILADCELCDICTDDLLPDLEDDLPPLSP